MKLCCSGTIYSVHCILSGYLFQSDNFNQSGFCCAPGVRKKKKKKKKKGKSDDIPNPYGLHSSEKQAAFWNGNSATPTGSDI